jgi:chemotaxis family two-component system response regulator Rcp1
MIISGYLYLPPDGQTVRIFRANQLFQNLIGNALKYRKDQPPLFAVRNNGIGIDPNYRETNMPEPALDLPSVNESWSGTADASGLNPDEGKAPPSTSASQSELVSPQTLPILLVEDNRADVYLLREAIAAAAFPALLHVVDDGEKAMDFIDRADTGEGVPCPTLVLLDLNLPRKSGLEVLQHVRRSRRCRNTPVLIVTSSDSERDRLETTRFGASGYFRKPSSYDAFMRIGAVVREMTAAPPGA